MGGFHRGFCEAGACSGVSSPPSCTPTPTPRLPCIAQSWQQTPVPGGAPSAPSETQLLVASVSQPCPATPLPCPWGVLTCRNGCAHRGNEVGSHLQPSKDLGLRPGPSLSTVPCELGDTGLVAQPFLLCLRFLTCEIGRVTEPSWEAAGGPTEMRKAQGLA